MKQGNKMSLNNPNKGLVPAAVEVKYLKNVWYLKIR